MWLDHERDHLWGCESYVHISNAFEECRSQQSRFVLAPTTPSCGHIRLVGQGPQPQPAQKCHRLSSALLASCFISLGRVSFKMYCHLPQQTKTYQKPPVTFPPGPAHRPQTERKVAPDFTDWLNTKCRLILRMSYIPCLHIFPDVWCKKHLICHLNAYFNTTTMESQALRRLCWAVTNSYYFLIPKGINESLQTKQGNNGYIFFRLSRYKWIYIKYIPLLWIRKGFKYLLRLVVASPQTLKHCEAGLGTPGICTCRELDDQVSICTSHQSSSQHPFLLVWKWASALWGLACCVLCIKSDGLLWFQ